MTLENWAAFAEIIGALAIIITLVYLAVQMRQTTTSTNAAAYQSWLAVHDNIFASFDDERFCQAINSGMLNSCNLTEENFLQFIAWARRYLTMQQSLYELYRNGVIEKEMWDRNLRDLVGVIRYPGMKQYWDVGAKEHFRKEFVQAIDEAEDFAPMFQWSSEQGFYKTEYHKE